MDLNWLPGGPYYEVSFITLNKYTNETELNNFINKFNVLNTIGNPPALPGDSKSLTFAGVSKVFEFTQYWIL
jgi:hypothetical protein